MKWRQPTVLLDRVFHSNESSIFRNVLRSVKEYYVLRTDNIYRWVGEGVGEGTGKGDTVFESEGDGVCDGSFSSKGFAVAVEDSKFYFEKCGDDRYYIVKRVYEPDYCNL